MSNAGTCYWCHWGWPKKVREIYNQALYDLCEDDLPLKFGPAHVVWEDENFESAQWCLDHFDEFTHGYDEGELAIVRESLERLAALPDRYKNPPEGYDWANDPGEYPPPDDLECSNAFND